MTLKQACENYHLTRRTIQGYEVKGLITPSCKNKYGHLLYDEDTVKKIVLIKKYQDLGFSLQEIKSLNDCSIEKRNKLIKDKVKELMKEVDYKKQLINEFSNKEVDL